MNKYLLTEGTLNEILGYLGTRPYVEVAHLVEIIRNSEIVADFGGAETTEPATESA